MASRLITTSFAIVSTAALLAGCDTVSGWFDGNSHQSSGSTGVSQSASSGNDARYGYDRGYSSNNYDTYGSTGAAPADSMIAPSRAGESVSADKVRHAQQALKDQGFYKGSVDGIVGPRTRDAVARYQRDHNLKQTAMLDDQTLRALDQRMTTSMRR